MTRFSLPVLVAKAVNGNKGWRPQWPDAEPKAEYDVVIVGAGGHGLGDRLLPRQGARHVTNVAVIDKGWLGGGNTGRNTTIIRSNYLYDESARHLRARHEAVGGPEPGAQLQRHVSRRAA